MDEIIFQFNFNTPIVRIKITNSVRKIKAELKNILGRFFLKNLVKSIT